MLHYAANKDFLSITYGINVYLNSAFQKFVYQDRMFRRNVNSMCNIFLKFTIIINNLHRPTTQDV